MSGCRMVCQAWSPTHRSERPVASDDQTTRPSAPRSVNPASEDAMVGRLAGKRALVTGGTQGIGEGIVRAFVAQGARVVTVARHPDRAAALARELAPGLSVETLDITDERAWKR